jgi:hypothetical protein
MKTNDLINALAHATGTPMTSPAGRLSRWLPLAALAAGGSFLLGLGLRTDIGSAAAMYPTAVKLGFGVLLAGIAGLGAMRLVRPDAKIAAPLTALGLVAVFVAVILTRDPSWMSAPAPRWTSALRCVTLIPIMALLPLAAFLAAMREGAVTRPEIAGGLAGLASAGLAILAYGLNCTEDSPMFVGLWYSAAALVSAAIGAVAARRVLVW